MLINRRGLLLGLASALAAPAVVRAASLMPVRGVILPPPGVAEGLLQYRREILREYLRQGLFAQPLLECWGKTLQRDEIVDNFRLL